MKMKNRTGCRISAFLMAVVLTCGASMGAMAAEIPDFDRKGSVFVELEDYEGRKMSGGSLALYQVAVLGYEDGNMSYFFTDAFADCGEELTPENLSDDSAELAARLGKWADAQEVSAAAEAGIEDGKVKFSDLQPGIYLVVQPEESEGFYLIDPFLVSIPLLENDSWSYDVNASPKAEVKPEDQQKEEKSGETAAPGTTASGAAPGGETGGEGTSGSGVSSVSGKLPQTGQLNWPIPFLAGGGLLLMLIGGGLVFCDRRKKNHAA